MFRSLLVFTALGLGVSTTTVAFAEPSACGRGLISLKSWRVYARQLECVALNPDAANAFAVVCAADGSEFSPAMNRYRTFETAYEAAVFALMSAPHQAAAAERARALSTLEREWETTGNREVVDRALDTIQTLARSCAEH